MAQKRALIAATLIAVNASEFFTQDIEDMEIIEGHFEVKDDFTPVGEVLKKAKQKPPQQKAQHKEQGQGAQESAPWELRDDAEASMESPSGPANINLPDIDLQTAIGIIMPNGKQAGDCGIPVLRAIFKHPRATPEQLQAASLIIEAKEKAA